MTLHRLTRSRFAPLCVLAVAATGARAQTLTNLGVAADASLDHAVVRGDRATVLVREGVQDLNGDGDTDDHVVHILRPSTGVLTSTGLGTGPSVLPPAPALGDRLCLVLVDEASFGVGGADLNGDGDATDLVLHAHDAATGGTTNLRVTAGLTERATAGDLSVFGVIEATQGSDLNGDGDVGDFVLHTWRAGSSAPVNHGLAIGTWAVGRGSAVVLVREADQGADFNQDGDLEDEVAHAYHAASGAITNLRLATRKLSVDAEGAGFYAIVADEATSAAGTDWNGDGDSNDAVLHAWIAPTATLRNLGSPVHLLFSGQADLSVANARIAWGADESGAGLDWNGDGDVLDSVLFAHDLRSNTTRNSGLALQKSAAGFRSLPFQDAVVALSVSEADQGGVDRNGDGDAIDLVAALYDTRTGSITNVGVAGGGGFQLSLSREVLAIAADERLQGGVDGNADGRLSEVTAVFDRSLGTTLVLPGVAGAQGPHALRGTVAFLTREDASLVDLNGDGDRLDAVLQTWERATDLVTNQSVAIESGNLGSSRNALVFRVREGQQGSSDLNADGDALDRVTHVLAR